MNSPSHAVLRVERGMIPDLRALLEECLELLADKLTGLERGGRMIDAWMNDPVSTRMRDVYNASVMEAPDGGYAMLRVYEELGRMEAEYCRIEDENAALFRYRA